MGNRVGQLRQSREEQKQKQKQQEEDSNNIRGPGLMAAVVWVNKYFQVAGYIKIARAGEWRIHKAAGVSHSKELVGIDCSNRNRKRYSSAAFNSVCSPHPADPQPQYSCLKQHRCVDDDEPRLKPFKTMA